MVFFFLIIDCRCVACLVERDGNDEHAEVRVSSSEHRELARAQERAHEQQGRPTQTFEE